jgi:hypothetical protein
MAMKLRRLRWYVWLAPGAMVMAVPVLAASRLGGADPVVVIGITAAVVMLLAHRLAWRHQAVPAALGLAGAIWACTLVDGSSMNWLRVGFMYGTGRYPAMTMGSPSNLPAILASGFGIVRVDELAFTLPAWLGETAVSWRVLLRTVFIVGTVLCGVAAGVHYRRRNMAFVIAACAPMLLFATFPAQIHERYVTYGAVVIAVFLAAGWRWISMYVALSLIATLPVLHGMLRGGNPAAFLNDEMGPGFGTMLHRNVAATHPGVGWGLIVLTLVCFYVAVRVWGVRPVSSPAPAGEAPSRSGEDLRR